MQDRDEINRAFLSLKNDTAYQQVARQFGRQDEADSTMSNNPDAAALNAQCLAANP
jgi:hypothetical protein